MKFSRIFSAVDNPYSGIIFATFQTAIMATDGSSVRSQGEVIAPSHWPQTAVDILADKYFRKAGVPSATCPILDSTVPDWLLPSQPTPDATFGHEHDARQVFGRMAGCWTYWGWKYNYFKNDEDSALAFRDELCHAMAMQMWAPNSPQFFNMGLCWAYGIHGSPSGQFRMNEAGQVVNTQDSYTHPQCHACFLNSVDDSLLGDGGIMDLWDREARVYKYGGGSGVNASRLRGKGEPLSGGGRASGVLSWLRIGDTTAGSIKSGGTTRRAAVMRILNDDHPDIEEFINWKVGEEAKVAAMVAGSKLIRRHIRRIVKAWPDHEQVLDAVRNAHSAGVPTTVTNRTMAFLRQNLDRNYTTIYDTAFEGDAYTTVSGQNANNSVNLSNAFMEAALADRPWNLRYRVSGEITKTVDAAQMLDDIATAAWSCADPGAFFGDNVNDWHTCTNDAKIDTANPCCEYLFIKDTACCLSSLNLLRFWHNDHFDYISYQYMVRLAVTVLDITNSIASFPSRQIATQTANYRTIGLGYANLGALVMTLGLPYDSGEGRAVCSLVTALMQAYAIQASAEIASELGSFPRYEANADRVKEVMAHHANYCYNNRYDGQRLPAAAWENLPTSLDHLHAEACNAFDAAVKAVDAYGLRNATLSVCAPTGTIGLLMSCATTGIEPDYALVKFKKLAGGGYLKIVNTSVPPALAALGYGQEQIDAICLYATGHGTFIGCPHLSTIIQRYGNEQMDVFQKKAKSCVDVRFLMENIGAYLSDEQIEEVNAHVCGAMTVEGAPYLKLEHYPVFDCATPCGTHGRRYLSVDAHLGMLAAAQPFISLGQSKTVNLPNSATVADVKYVFVRAWQLGLKAVPVYRDGSKLSQILNAQTDIDEDAIEELPSRIGQVQKVVYEMARRRPLPSRRVGYTQKLKVAGQSIFLRTGQYEDGSLGEIFIDVCKDGTPVSTWMHYFAISVSLALQYGVPLDEFVDAFLFSRSEPSGVVGGHDAIKMCTSMADLIVRDLAINYLGRDDLRHVPAEHQAVPAPQPTGALVAAGQALPSTQEARIKGYLGAPCPNCHSLTLKQAGRCRSCDTCGASDGCS